MHRVKYALGLGVIALVLVACGEDGEDLGDDGSNDDGGGECLASIDAEFPATDDSSCTPAATDFTPGLEDEFPACVSDDGTYHLVEGTPSSAARVEAAVEIRELLSGEPTPDDFTAARAAYSIDEGLESRVLRREDLHYPPIPESDFDPDFEPDKQCSSAANVDKHPDRCAGPAKIAPLIDEAFAAGQTGDGSPLVNAAKVDAGLTWFLFLSTFKEANTCVTTAKDCDSSWAYYTGGVDRAGGLAYAGDVRRVTDLGHNRIFDGILAVRCWRDLYPIEDSPTRDDLDDEGERLLGNALQQLDTANWYGLAQIVRDRLERQAAVCDESAEANWAWVQIVGPVLDFQAATNDSSAAATLGALWTNDAPTVEDLQAGVDAIDAAFPCP